MTTMKDQATRRASVWAVVITGLASFMAGLDSLVIVTALPTISEELGGALDDLEWTVNAYTLSFAVLMMLAAAVGDRFGRRKVFVAGLMIFTLASVGAALAPDIDWLIIARAAQGVGAAVIMPLSLTLLTAAVPAEKRVRPDAGALAGFRAAAGAPLTEADAVAGA